MIPKENLDRELKNFTAKLDSGMTVEEALTHDQSDHEANLIAEIRDLHDLVNFQKDIIETHNYKMNKMLESHSRMRNLLKRCVPFLKELREVNK